MFHFVTRVIISVFLFSVSLLAATRVSAEAFSFSYVFEGTVPSPPYAAGSKLFGQIDGTRDVVDPNLIIVNSFGAVSLSRPGLPLFTFPPIAKSEFNSWPAGGSPVMTIDGSELDFRACPSGFTSINRDDCPFATEGGFVIGTVAAFDPNRGFATAADGSGTTGSTGDCGGVPGCRVRDFAFPGLPGVWAMAALPDGVDSTVVIDPTVTIGTNTTVNQGSILEEDIQLGNNVLVNQNTSIGSGTTVGNQVTINKDGDVGSEVFIGNDVTIGQKAVIEGPAVIGDGVIINRNTYICANVVIGALAVIGKNQVVKVDVPMSGELPGTNPAPDPSDPGLCALP